MDNQLANTLLLFIANTAINLFGIALIFARANAKRNETDAKQDSLAFTALNEKVQEIPALKEHMANQQKELTELNSRLNEQGKQNTILVQTIESQSRKITQLQIDLDALTNEHQKEKTQKDQLADLLNTTRDELNQTILEKTIAESKLEAINSTLGRIHISLSGAMEVVPNIKKDEA